jgi:hypothetical protein
LYGHVGPGGAGIRDLYGDLVGSSSGLVRWPRDGPWLLPVKLERGWPARIGSLVCAMDVGSPWLSVCAPVDAALRAKLVGATLRHRLLPADGARVLSVSEGRVRLSCGALGSCSGVAVGVYSAQIAHSVCLVSPWALARALVSDVSVRWRGRHGLSFVAGEADACRPEYLSEESRVSWRRVDICRWPSVHQLFVSSRPCRVFADLDCEAELSEERWLLLLVAIRDALREVLVEAGAAPVIGIHVAEGGKRSAHVHCLATVLANMAALAAVMRKAVSLASVRLEDAALRGLAGEVVDFGVYRRAKGSLRTVGSAKYAFGDDWREGRPFPSAPHPGASDAAAVALYSEDPASYVLRTFANLCERRDAIHPRYDGHLRLQSSRACSELDAGDGVLAREVEDLMGVTVECTRRAGRRLQLQFSSAGATSCLAMGVDHKEAPRQHLEVEHGESVVFVCCRRCRARQACGRLSVPAQLAGLAGGGSSRCEELAERVRQWADATPEPEAAKRRALAAFRAQGAMRTHEVRARYLSEAALGDLGGTVFVVAGMGCGKTCWLVSRLGEMLGRGQRILVVTHRRSLSTFLGNAVRSLPGGAVKLLDYRQVADSEPPARARRINEADVFVTCYDSLHRMLHPAEQDGVALPVLDFDTLVMDESESLLLHAANSSTLRDSRGLAACRLLSLIRHTQLVYLLDGTMSHWQPRWVSELRAAPASLVFNMASGMNDRELRLTCEEGRLEAELLRALARGERVALGVTSREYGAVVASMVRARRPETKVLLINSESPEELRCGDANALWAGYDLVCYSASIDTGISVDRVDLRFDRIMLHVHGCVGPTPLTAVQMIGRVRNPVDRRVLVYVPAWLLKQSTSVAEARAQEVVENLACQFNAKQDLRALCTEDASVEDLGLYAGAYMKLLAHGKATAIEAGRSWVACFAQLALMNGIAVHFHGEDPQPRPGGAPAQEPAAAQEPAPAEAHDDDGGDEKEDPDEEDPDEENPDEQLSELAVVSQAMRHERQKRKMARLTSQQAAKLEVERMLTADVYEPPVSDAVHASAMEMLETMASVYGNVHAEPHEHMLKPADVARFRSLREIVEVAPGKTFQATISDAGVFTVVSGTAPAAGARFSGVINDACCRFQVSTAAGSEFTASEFTASEFAAEGEQSATGAQPAAIPFTIAMPVEEARLRLQVLINARNAGTLRMSDLKEDTLETRKRRRQRLEKHPDPPAAVDPRRPPADARGVPGPGDPAQPDSRSRQPPPTTDAGPQHSIRRFLQGGAQDRGQAAGEFAVEQQRAAGDLLGDPDPRGELETNPMNRLTHENMCAMFQTITEVADAAPELMWHILAHSVLFALGAAGPDDGHFRISTRELLHAKVIFNSYDSSYSGFVNIETTGGRCVMTRTHGTHPIPGAAISTDVTGPVTVHEVLCSRSFTVTPDHDWGQHSLVEFRASSTRLTGTRAMMIRNSWIGKRESMWKRRAMEIADALDKARAGDNIRTFTEAVSALLFNTYGVRFKRLSRHREQDNDMYGLVASVAYTTDPEIAHRDRLPLIDKKHPRVRAARNKSVRR